MSISNGKTAIVKQQMSTCMDSMVRGEVIRVLRRKIREIVANTVDAIPYLEEVIRDAAHNEAEIMSR